jgi:hypothetical protein
MRYRPGTAPYLLGVPYELGFIFSLFLGYQEEEEVKEGKWFDGVGGSLLYDFVKKGMFW